MRLLIDTNIFLEIILGQQKAAESKVLLYQSDEHQLHVTDFCLHSIGILLFHQKKHDLFLRFMTDILDNCGMKIISLLPEDMTAVAEAAGKYRLDFDDAYQYTSAEKYGLTLFSFDHDFDRTPIGRKEPRDFL